MTVIIIKPSIRSGARPQMAGDPRWVSAGRTSARRHVRVSGGRGASGLLCGRRLAAPRAESRGAYSMMLELVRDDSEQLEDEDEKLREAHCTPLDGREEDAGY